MSVLVDPYMFELSDTQEIYDNISFFLKMIQLCTKRDSTSRVHILIYKGMFERMCQRSIQPFPINIQMIKDPDLRKTVMQINRSFNNALIGFIESVDIDECAGDQEFVVKSGNGIAEDDNYYEMFCTLLLPCYSHEIEIEDKILTGIKKDGKHIGDDFQIECKCSKCEYIKACVFSGIDEFFSGKEKAIELFKEKKKKGIVHRVDSVSAEMGEHHNHVQADEKKFRTLNDLSAKNKRVLKLLQEVGLNKIIFGRFTSQGVKETGTMSIYNIDEKDTQDIVTVKFNAETGFQLFTDLYFPKGIGRLLYDYFKTDQMTYQNVTELLEKI